MKSRKGIAVTITIMIAIILVLGGTTVGGFVQAAKYKGDLTYSYERAMSDLKNCVVNIETTLDKSRYANTPTQQNGLAAKLMRETSMAKAALAVLPLEDDSLSNVNKFISQTGDFSMALSAKISAGGSISEEEYASIESLQEYAAALRESLSDLKANLDAPAMMAGFRQTADDFTDYPTLIYDGPFSDHIGQMEPQLIKGQPELSLEQAREACAQFLEVEPQSLTAEPDSAGGLPSWNFSGETMRISISKAGGAVISLIDSRPIAERELDYEEAASSAHDFLEARGISGMKESYYVIDGGICTINYAYEEDEVLYYPDLVKVSVALDNGGVVEYNATGYVMNHTGRDLEEPALTMEQAVERVSPHLTPEPGRLTLIPTPGLHEVLCYEFSCTAENGERVLVYINASTGMEEQIFILMQSDAGVLVK